MIVAIGKSFKKDNRTIRADVIADLKVAFAVARLLVQNVLVAGAPETERYTTTAGIFRLVMDHCGVDRSDAHLQETWLAWVQEAFDRTLAGDGEGHQPNA